MSDGRTDCMSYYITDCMADCANRVRVRSRGRFRFRARGRVRAGVVLTVCLTEDFFSSLKSP
jgi:hypothetical protein